MCALAGGFLNSEPLEKSYINFLWAHSWCRGKALKQDVGSNPDSLADLWLGFILYFSSLICKMGFPGSWVGKESACSAEDLGSIPESGRSPGEGNGKPLQYSCPEKSPVQRSLYDYTVKVTNRFKGLDLIHSVLEELWKKVCNIVQEAVITTISKRK